MIRRAFSLAETLVAIAVLSMLVGSVFGFLSGLAARRSQLEAMTADSAAAASLFSSIEADVLTCLAGAGAAGEGVAGDSRRLRLASRATLLDPGAGVVELVRAEYAFDGSSRSVSMTRSGLRGGGGAEVLSQRVELLRFRYRTGGVWQETFSSVEAGGLPEAIEVAIWFGDGLAPPAPDLEDPEADLPLDDLPPMITRAPDRVRIFGVPDGPDARGAGA